MRQGKVRSCVSVKSCARGHIDCRTKCAYDDVLPVRAPWIRIERVLLTHTRVDPGARERGARVTFHRALFPRSHRSDQQKPALLKRHPRPLGPPPPSLSLLFSRSFSLSSACRTTVFSLPSLRFFCFSRSRTALINSIHRRRRFPRLIVMLTPWI